MRPLDAVKMPSRIAALPRDTRGFPIPHNASRDPITNKPNFRVLDQAVSFRCMGAKQCPMCGQPLGANIAFIGGPESWYYRFFIDAGMHRDCAEYAIRVCPHLSNSTLQYAPTEYLEKKVPDLKIIDEVSTERPPINGVFITRSYALRQTQNGGFVVEAQPWVSQQWYKDGVLLEDQIEAMKVAIAWFEKKREERRAAGQPV